MKKIFGLIVFLCSLCYGQVDTIGTNGYIVAYDWGLYKVTGVDVQQSSSAYGQIGWSSYIAGDNFPSPNTKFAATPSKENYRYPNSTLAWSSNGSDTIDMQVDSGNGGRVVHKNSSQTYRKVIRINNRSFALRLDKCYIIDIVKSVMTVDSCRAFTSLAIANGKIFASGAWGAVMYIYSSNDTGRTWDSTLISPSARAYWYSEVTSDEKALFADSAHTGTFYTSTDGVIWTKCAESLNRASIPVGTTLSGLAVNSSCFFISYNSKGGDKRIVRILRLYGDIPDPTVTIYPVDSSVNISLNPTLIWHSAYRAQKYYVYVRRIDARGFATTVIRDSLTDTTYQIINPLVPNTKYVWLIIAKNIQGFGPSIEDVFTTAPDLSTSTRGVKYGSNVVRNVLRDYDWNCLGQRTVNAKKVSGIYININKIIKVK